MKCSPNLLINLVVHEHSHKILSICKMRSTHVRFSIFQIGWRGFGREYINSSSWGWQLLNTIYPIFIVLMLFYTYIYEIIACQWKLNIQKDTQVGTICTQHTVPNINCSYVVLYIYSLISLVRTRRDSPCEFDPLMGSSNTWTDNGKNWILCG